MSIVSEQFQHQMYTPITPTLKSRSHNKQNEPQSIKPKQTLHNTLERQAMQRLNQLSEIDLNAFNPNQTKGFSAWDHPSGQNPQHVKEKKMCGKVFKVRRRGLSFWRKVESKIEVNNQKGLDARERRRQSVNTSAGRRYSNFTQQNNENSSEVFVRKFSSKDRSQGQLAKRYLLNNTFQEDVPSLKGRSFQTNSKTMLVNKRRPKTENGANLTRLSNEGNRNLFSQQCRDPKAKLDILIVQSQKLMRKGKRRGLSKKMQRETQKKSNALLQVLKQRYKSYVYASEVL